MYIHWRLYKVHRQWKYHIHWWLYKVHCQCKACIYTGGCIKYTASGNIIYTGGCIKYTASGNIQKALRWWHTEIYTAGFSYSTPMKKIGGPALTNRQCKYIYTGGSLNRTVSVKDVFTLAALLSKLPVEISYTVAAV
jgi:hypothetical protein